MAIGPDGSDGRAARLRLPDLAPSAHPILLDAPSGAAYRAGRQGADGGGGVGMAKSGRTGVTGVAGNGPAAPPKSLLAAFASRARLPELRPGEWVQSLLIRIGIPVGIALLYYGAGHRSLEGDLANVAGVLASFSVAWVLHWYYARWRKALGARQFVLARWAGTFIWLGVLIWLGVRVAACLTALDPTGSLGTWEELSARYEAVVASAGVWGVLVLAALVRLVGLLWKRWLERAEPTEPLWWVDYLVTFALYFLRGLVALSVAAVASTLLAPGFGYAPLYDGPWWNGTLAFLRQLADAGALGMLLAAAAFRVVSARCHLAITVRERRRGAGDLLCIWGVRFLRVAEVLAYGALVVGLAGSIVALINPVAGLSGLQWANLIAREFLPTTLVLPVLGLVALRFAWLAYRWWRDAPVRAWSSAATSGSAGSGSGAQRSVRPSKPPKRPFILRALVWLVATAVLVGLVFLIGLVLRDVALDVSRGVGPAAAVQIIRSAIVDGLEQPNIWGMLAVVVCQIIAALLVLVVGLVVLGIILGADGGGSSGGGAMGGGAAGGGGGGAGASAVAGTQTLRDRYGRKLATVEDEGLFGTRVYDRWGRPIGKERASFDGGKRYEISGHDVRVRDAAFGSGKTVSVDGEREGRIHEGTSGNGPWFDDRWK